VLAGWLRLETSLIDYQHPARGAHNVYAILQLHYFRITRLRHSFSPIGLPPGILFGTQRMAAILHTLLATFLKLPFARTALYGHTAATTLLEACTMLDVSVGAAWMAWHNDLKPDC
jgi:hypothetical protein